MIQVVERTGKMLEAFTPEHSELTLTECAEATGLTKSSAHRLLTSLAEIEMVERHGTRWRLGPRVISMATVRLGQLDLRREAAPRMRRLGLTHRVAVAFSLPHGTEMIYIERQESPEPFAASARLGGRAAIWAGAAGRAILAQLDPNERELHLDHEEWHRLPVGTRTEVLDEIVAARDRGYAIDSGSFFEGVSGVAVAIRDHHGHPVAALSAIVPPERLRAEGTETLGAALQTTAAELEHVSGLLL